jgi:uncharacterized iron-regulated membrane protein
MNDIDPFILRKSVLRSVLWRLHVWAAIFASPFVLVAALTGLLYVFTPQIEQYLYGHLDHVNIQSEQASLDLALTAATAKSPVGWQLHAISPASQPGETHQFAFVPPALAKDHGSGHSSYIDSSHENTNQFLKPIFGFPKNALVVYVNPYSLQVTGTLEQQQRFAYWAKKLHSSLLQGGSWRWMIEWGASWFLVMLLSGIWLAWPDTFSDLLPKVSVHGRMAWKRWHAAVGLGMSLLSFVIVGTGLTWSQVAGQQVRYLRDMTGQGSPQVPAITRRAEADEKQLISAHEAWISIEKATGGVRMQMLPPNDTNVVWRAAQMERTDPLKRFDLLLDAYSGKVVYLSTWNEQPLFGKATAVGIPFHRAEYGVWNQVLLFIFGASVLFSMTTGWVMVLKRLRKGVGIFPVIQKNAWRTIPLLSVIPFAALLWLMPLLVIGVVLIICYEMIFIVQAHLSPTAKAAESDKSCL